MTPDSFSDGGLFLQTDHALKRVAQMLEEGMDILDIGAESTRPGHQVVSAVQEWERLARVIPFIRREWPELMISVDTWKPEVAQRALDAGADWINDVWGGRRGDFFPEEVDHSKPGMSQVMAAAGCPVILMHNRKFPHYKDFWAEVTRDFERMLELAIQAGVKQENIWLDPGFGFGKTPAHNLEILRHVDRIVALGHPVLLGTSRKSTIGLVLDKPVNERAWGTAATVAWGIAKGCRMIRVHDIVEMKQVATMCDAIGQGLQWDSLNHG